MPELNETQRQRESNAPPGLNELIGPMLGDGHGRYFVTHVIKEDDGFWLLRVIDRTAAEPSHTPYRAYVFDCSEDAQPEWERRIRLAADARSRSLIPIVDWAIRDNRAAVILDADSAVPLFDWLERRPDIAQEQAVWIAIGLCEAAHELHTKGVSGARLAPGAVFMTPDGATPIVKAFSPFLESIDQRPVEVDIQDIALTLTHLLGCAVATEIRNRTLRQIVLRAAGMTPAPYRSADAIATDLRRFLGHHPIDWASLGAFRDLALWARRSPRVASGVAAALLLVMATAAVTAYAVAQTRTRTNLEAALTQLEVVHAAGLDSLHAWRDAINASDSEEAFSDLYLDFRASALSSGRFTLSPREWIGVDAARDIEPFANLFAAMTFVHRYDPAVHEPGALEETFRMIEESLAAGVLDDLESRLRETISQTPVSAFVRPTD